MFHITVCYFCDSVPIPVDMDPLLQSNLHVEWYDDEKYEPESEL